MENVFKTEKLIYFIRQELKIVSYILRIIGLENEFLFLSLILYFKIFSFKRMINLDCKLNC